MPNRNNKNKRASKIPKRAKIHNETSGSRLFFSFHCFKTSSKINQNYLNKILSKKSRNKNDFVKVLKIMKLSNTKSESLKFMTKYLKKAQKNIKRFEGDSDKVYLDNLINYLLIRDH